MSDLETKRDDFRKRLENKSQEFGAAPQFPETPAPAELESLPPDSDLDQRWASWEDLLDRRLREFRGEPSLPAAPTAAPVVEPTVQPAELPVTAPAVESQQPALQPPHPFAVPQPTLQGWLDGLDAMLLDELELARLPRPAGFTQHVRLVESDAEIMQAAAQACGLPTVKALPADKAHRLGVLHLPGQGTLLNTAYYARQYGSSDFSRYTLQQRALLISEVARRRWGWGYLLEYTRLGQLAGQSGLWPALTAHRLGWSIPDTSRLEAAEALRRSWMLCEEGWEDWVWQYITFKARAAIGQHLFHRPRPGRWFEMLSRIVNLFPFYVFPFGVRMRLLNLLDLLNFLFLEQSELLPRTINSTLIAVQKFCQHNDAAIAAHLGEPFSRFLGRIYYSQLEAAVGIFSVPHAVQIIAYGEGLDLSAMDAAALLAAAAENPRANPDTRLAILSKVDKTVKYDRKALFIAAWERFKLDGPRPADL
ncbi:MAG: hypothetical protein MUC85_01950 [Anaerolineales bacterium]|jgi:hypothetical protein|nr:hypothetical protein [Anaerolineales bacterium]